MCKRKSPLAPGVDEACIEVAVQAGKVEADRPAGPVDLDPPLVHQPPKGRGMDREVGGGGAGVDELPVPGMSPIPD